jgi:hypothetical protein
VEQVGDIDIVGAVAAVAVERPAGATGPRPAAQCELQKNME